MSDQTGITELDIQEVWKDSGGDSENEFSEEELFLDLQYELYKEELSKMDLSEEDSPEAKNPEEKSLMEKKECPDLKTDSLKSSKKKKKRRKLALGWKVFFSAIMVILLALVALTVTVTGIYIHGKQQMTDQGGLNLPDSVQAISEHQGTKITYEGRIYQMQQDASHVLFIGKNTDGAHSMILMNFNRSTGEVSAMPIPRELLNLDFTSAMYYTDMQEAVSQLLYGLPVHGYMVVDLQMAAKKTGQILSNTASDKGCVEILMDFLRHTMKNTGNDITSIRKTVKDMQGTMQWNMDMTELCYLYVTVLNCTGSRITEAQVRDSEDILPAILKTFYSAV